MRKLCYCILLLLFSFSTEIRTQQNNVDTHFKVDKVKKKARKQKALKRSENTPKITDPLIFLQSRGWILEQIEKEFSFFQQGGAISKSKISFLANDESYAHLLLVKYSIKNNQVYVSHKIPHNWLIKRVNSIEVALQAICRIYSLPDMEFIVSMHDAVGEQLDVPLFVMAKHRDNVAQILIPDFEALRGAYQVLQGRDITRDAHCSWEERRNQMIWRGSTAQHSQAGYPLSFNLDDDHCISRVKLCGFSAQFPEMIDAKFTIYAQGAESILSLELFRGSFISYEDQLRYKYQMLIDGNTCSYTASGWKWFSGSLVFKEDSDQVQWYYNGLQPNIHYIPVKEGLGDLMEKLQWANEHDEEAKTIAGNARAFALNCITQEMNFVYLYYTLLAYDKLLNDKQ